jgi:hypothetical protein
MSVENATSLSRPVPDGTEYVRATAGNVSFIFGQLLNAFIFMGVFMFVNMRVQK